MQMIPNVGKKHRNSHFCTVICYSKHQLYNSNNNYSFGSMHSQRADDTSSPPEALVRSSAWIDLMITEKQQAVLFNY